MDMTDLIVTSVAEWGIWTTLFLLVLAAASVLALVICGLTRLLGAFLTRIRSSR
jgi:hypothetical protein